MRDRPEAWLGRGEPAHARGGGAGSWVNWSMRRTEGRGLGGAGEGVGRCQAAGRGWRMRRADGCGLGGANACAERWGGVGWGWRMRRPKADRCAGAVGACAVGKTREGGAAHVRYRGGGGGVAAHAQCHAKRRSPYGRRRGHRDRGRVRAQAAAARARARPAYRHPRRHLPLRRGAGVLSATPPALLPGTATGHRTAGPGLRPAWAHLLPGRLPPGTTATGQGHRALSRPLPALEARVYPRGCP